ncbi:MAG: class I SAM-dependent methyltransferase [Anaerolineae bacterium]|nr:MAG: class I SAM-dependent methyltransferase [Anaerolineae bacterium]
MAPIEYARIADLYDVYVQTTFDISFFLNEAKKSAGEVLELTSGTGRVSIPLVEAGIHLTCVDSSPEMLAILREKLDRRGLSASVHRMDIRQLALGRRFDLIIIPFHSFAELLSPSDQRRTLVGIYDHLSESGRFICTLHNPPVRLRPADGRLRLRGRCSLESDGGTLLLWGLETYDPEEGVVNGLQFFETYDPDGVMRSRRVLETRFRLLQKAGFEELVCAAGFEVVALYGDYAYAEFQEDKSPFMIWVLQKQGRLQKWG